MRERNSVGEWNHCHSVEANGWKPPYMCACRLRQNTVRNGIVVDRVSRENRTREPSANS